MRLVADDRIERCCTRCGEVECYDMPTVPDDGRLIRWLRKFQHAHGLRPEKR